MISTRNEGTNRGKLYAIHLRPIRFKTEQFKTKQEETMPPEE